MAVANPARRTVRLDTPWQLFRFPEPHSPVRQPADLESHAAAAIPAAVPGNVELDLMRAGLLPELFRGTNIHLSRTLEGDEWWYRTTFATPAGWAALPAAGDAGEVDLVCGGLDCLATVWLNGQLLGRTDNMLIEHRFPVTGQLRLDADNELVVRLGSAVLAARRQPVPPVCHAQPSNYEQLAIRKAPHMYGWDIAPRAVSAGIWRPVELQFLPPTRIGTLYYATLGVQGGTARLRVAWDIRTNAPLADPLELRFCGTCGAHRFEHTTPVRFTAGHTYIDVPDARLWWPRGYGDPALYEVTTELLQDGRVVDGQVDHLGLRTVELVRTEVSTVERPGQFLFRCNGESIFCRGSNWVPADAFHSRDAARYAQMLELCVDLECNMLRCWGGNVYEDHAFFDLCDRHGIMVWQDFAFACAIYPQDDAFADRVRHEAESVVRKLRNHPSLVLWAGDNEVDEVYLALGLDPGDNRLTREVLPQVCRTEDPWRPFLPSSPYATPEVVRRGNRALMPEQHLWGPRDYYKSRFYAEHTAHFASEIGYHGCPAVSSVRRFIDPDHLWPPQDNAQWLAHATDPVPGGSGYGYRIQLMADQIRELFGQVPAGLDDFALASQISQAEAKKYFVERFRQARWRTTGILWWNVIDGWPQFSDAVVDYYFQRKLAYYYLRRVQQPFCLMLAEPESWHGRVVAANDTRHAVAGTFTIRDADSGERVLTGTLHVAPNSSQEVGRLRLCQAEQRLFLLEWETPTGTGGNHYLLGRPPFALEQYRRWLPLIAALACGFDADAVAR